MAKRYGVPYQGSKNSIAQKIIDFLPAGTCLMDLFAGGCAITHAALEQMNEIAPKWQRVIANDINPLPTELFRKSINGEMRDEKRWISREDFQRLRGKDAYVTLCWSFSNNQQQYLYGRKWEPWKKAYHYARVLDDWSLITDIVGELPPEAHDNLKQYISRHNTEINTKYIAWYEAGGARRSQPSERTDARIAELGELGEIAELGELGEIAELGEIGEIAELGDTQPRLCRRADTRRGGNILRYTV